MHRNFLIATAVILLGVMTRFIPHPVNFTALTALAIWAPGLLGSRRMAVIVPMVIMIVSDWVIGFHSTMGFVYGALILIGVLALGASPERSWVRAGSMSLVGSLLFFIVTNFGVWVSQELYPLTNEGLMECYVMALPFLKNQILGDLFYCGLVGICAQTLASRRQSLEVDPR